MRNYCTFMQKELTENLRRRSVFVLACVLAFVAISSPLTSRYLLEIIGFFSGSDEASQLLLGSLPEPTFGDSYINFYGNMAQLGGLTVILMYMGAVLREKRSGTSDMMLAKGLKAWEFVLAKFTVAGGIIAAMTLASVIVAYGYTLLLFGEAGGIVDVLLGGLAFVVFAVMLLAITLMFSSIAKGTGGSAVLSLVTYFLLGLSTMLMGIGKYSPGSLMSSPILISLGQVPDGFVGSLAAAAVVSALSILAAVRLTATRQVQ